MDNTGLAFTTLFSLIAYMVAMIRLTGYLLEKWKNQK